MFNVMKKRANDMRAAKMAASHEQRRGAPDKVEEPKYNMVKSSVREIRPTPSSAPAEDHATLAAHHQRIADHLRQVANGSHEPGCDSAGPTHEPSSDLEEDY